MATGNTTVWVPVDDMDAAVRFYGETLGLSVKSTGSDWSEIDAGPLTIGLNAREGTSRPGDKGGAVITFQPEGSIDDEVSRLQARGSSSRAASAITRGAGSRRSPIRTATNCRSTRRPPETGISCGPVGFSTISVGWASADAVTAARTAAATDSPEEAAAS